MSTGVAHPSPAHGHSAPNSISIPWVLLASALMGLGVLMLAVWLVTFDFLFLSGAVVLVVGFWMVFDPRMGSDHA